MSKFDSGPRVDKVQPIEPRYPSAVEQFDAIYHEQTERSVAHERARTMARLIDEYVNGNHIGVEIRRLLAEQEKQQKRTLEPQERDYFMTYYRARIEEARAFFVTGSPDFPESPLVRVTRDYDYLTPPTTEAEKTEWEKALLIYMRETVIMAFEQHWQDPEVYVSHDFSHGLRCADYGLSLLTALDESGESAAESESMKQIAERYNITPGEAAFLVSQVITCHDCGYPHIHGRGKAAHAVASAELFSTDKIENALKTLITSPDAKKDLIQRDLYEALAYHGADVAPEKFDARIITDRGTYLVTRANIQKAITTLTQEDTSEIRKPRVIQKIELATRHRDLQSELESTGIPTETLSANMFQGRSIDALSEDGSGKKLLGVEFRLGNLETNPLLPILRIADNLDIAKNRLGPIKNTALYQQVLERIGEGGDLHETAKAKYAEGVTVYKQWKHGIIAEIMTSSPDATALPSRNDLPATDTQTITRERVAEVASLIETWDMRHAGSCTVIDSVAMYWESGTVIIKITVNELYKKTQGVTFTEQWHNRTGQQMMAPTSIADHQIFRLRQALEVNRLSDDEIRIFVVDADGVPIDA